MKVLDFIFPKKCVICKKAGDYICASCFINLSFDTKSQCLICKRPTYNDLIHPTCFRKYSIDGCFSALTYNKATRKLIYSFKNRPYLADLSSILADLFYDSIIQNENFNKEIKKGEWVLIPIPLSSLMLKKRGYNQAEILAKALSKKFNFKMLNALKRPGSAKNAFYLKPNGDVKNKKIFLIDDVVITGVTLKEAAKVLKKSGAKRVIGLTLARN